MSRRIILALVAVAALGAAALAPTPASAYRHGAHSASRGPSGHSAYARAPRLNRAPAMVYRAPANRGPVMMNRGPHMATGYHHHRDHYWWRHHHRPYWVSPTGSGSQTETASTTRPAYAATSQPAAAAPAANACPCLKKTYLADERAKFQDVCTGEEAEEDENASTTADANASDDCACVRKTYLADGRAKFSDTCTGEVAEVPAAETGTTETSEQQ
jgi:hypothetical protein